MPGTNSRFGYNADFTAFIPLAANGGEGLLWVNHEYLSQPVYADSFPVVVGGVASIQDEMADVGGACFIRAAAHDRWTILASSLTRRYDASTRTGLLDRLCKTLGTSGARRPDRSGVMIPPGTPFSHARKTSRITSRSP